MLPSTVDKHKPTQLAFVPLRNGDGMPRANMRRSIDSESNLAERIAAERKSRGLSYEGLAKLMTDAGCSIQGSAIYKIEKGTPPRRVTVDELVALSRVLGASVDDLLTPIELVRKERAKALIDGLSPAGNAMLDGIGRLLGIYSDYFELAATDPELFEYVDGHWFPGVAQSVGEYVLPQPFSVEQLPGFDFGELTEAIKRLLLVVISTAGDVVRTAQRKGD